MGLKVVQATEVSCQRCDKRILVNHWWEAKEHGWAVPSDGHLQLCPDCCGRQKAEFKAEYIQSKIIQAIDDIFKEGSA